jgi:aspartyl-tRNA synthetase
MAEERMLAATSMRTHRCGDLRAADVGSTVKLGGWVHRRRDLGGLVFVDLRDRTGIVQVAVRPEEAAAFAVASRLGSETVILVGGSVVARPEGQANPEMPTGEIEVHATHLEVAGAAVTPAIPVARARGEALASEELRLRHRHLDLRRSELARNMELRHRLLQRTRAELSAMGFLEIETPILTRPTPEGARDYLVPSRIYPGEFFALPQSPQLYKQLLMVAGYDRYFQVARCFRDEDLRADRQPEFTQIDLEASFVAPADIQAVTERLLVALWAEGGERIEAPFPRMAHAEALERYGTDKPDLRYAIEIRDVSGDIGADSGDFLRAAVERGERVRVIVVPGGGALSRKQFDQLTGEAKTMRASGLLWLRVGAEGPSGPGVKALGPALVAKLAPAAGDAVVGCAGPAAVVAAALGRVRLELAGMLELRPSTRHAFVWIERFPMFEADPETGARVPMHHPFTAPVAEDAPLITTDPDRVRSTHYDPVYNGVELGSGSIRIVDPALQQQVLDLIGIGPEEAQRRFGFLLDGLRSGAPPHGGIALGFDRIVMLLAGAESLRDVIAFPKTAQARALFEDAPAPVRSEDLEELGLEVRA